jgi:hypothetical protein
MLSRLPRAETLSVVMSYWWSSSLTCPGNFERSHRYVTLIRDINEVMSQFLVSYPSRHGSYGAPGDVELLKTDIVYDH